MRYSYLTDRVWETKSSRHGTSRSAFGEKLLFDDLNFMLPPNGIVGVIGPNGAGKTTLFRLIMELEKPDAGTFEVGETVKLAYVDQQHKDIDPNKTVYDVVAQGNETIRMGGRDINSRAYLSRFNFAEPTRANSAVYFRAVSETVCNSHSH